MTDHICFIGGGNMGSAIITGLVDGPSACQITVCDPVAAIRQRHAAAGLTVSADPSPAADADVVVLAVKPQVAPVVLADVASHLEHGPLVISIMAGITIASLQLGLPTSCRVIRTMPNTPMAIGAGMVGLAAAAGVSDADQDRAEALFAGAAKVLRLNEDRIDALTAVSGSGPAFLFRIAEAQVSAAIKLGFSQAEAELLVGTTLQGSIDYLMAQDGFPAAALRQQVTSPGGTTAAGLAQMAKIDPMFTAVYEAAEARGRELSAGG